ncbi:3-phosphoserine/phosphohydroxythreonine transaminase [Vagococcus entomophilus]|uniref:Phosphoserine aminotransferase n=1 Tax=Vagococcus entomophilus TaxID=1160095 RepID=A0A430AFW8_9ENTE|nr:3-phosphoserine/phosphohydroxythreonine transaminase [Vagococcus entomophilus]RSU06621.1 phosphoserine transaminase [Vagococcus entomophilus]
MKEVYNFSAGPAVLPKPVLKKAQQELLNYHDSGMSVMELSHRSSLFEEIIENSEQLLRQLMGIPSNYRVLFLQGGASLQFSMIPLNLAKNKTACYINTGSWSKKAISEAKKIAGVTVKTIASSEEQHFNCIPALDQIEIPKDAAYVHITTNNTIEGTVYTKLPQTGSVPLIADMSSDILSKQYNINDFGMIYAGAQKNIGPAGLTVVIIRDDLLNQEAALSSMLDYKIQAESHSLYNTPPTFAIYIAQLVFEWLTELGGIAAIEKQNKEKAAKLYAAIDNSKLFCSPVEPNDRSIMNIPFVTNNQELDKKFIADATKIGFENLKGHRSVGGMRASLYNAFPEQGVAALIDFMHNFEAKHLGGQSI